MPDTPSNPIRAALGRWRRDAAWMRELRGVGPRVFLFQWRALRLARRSEDLFSLISVTRPGDTRTLLELARDRHRVVELGTGTGWTAITLALDDAARQVVSYDLEARGAERYLQLVNPDVRRRIELVVAPGSVGARDGEAVDLLYIDSSHEREPTVTEFRAWQPSLSPGALVLFDDYTNTDFPGVREAVEELRLEGERRGKLFIYRHG